jgi:MoaA/NifB/PqqE/SkfB family radical SAM enzyme
MFSIPVVDIYVTGACNLGCRYCFGELDSKAGMTRDIFLQSLDFAQQAGAAAIEFCGGEPLLYKDLTWAVKIAQERSFELILRTNGHYLTQHRSFIADHFNTVGISLDGDASSNDLLRPAKNPLALTAEQKFQIPLQEISELKAINPKMQILLASVATRLNVDGLRRLALILIEQRIPLDLWKVHQFLPNNFRGKLNIEEFHLDATCFQDLKRDLAKDVNGTFPLIFRRSEEIDGSCLVINGDGDILLGSRNLGNVSRNSPEILCDLLARAGIEDAIVRNKKTTYGGGLSDNSKFIK